MPDSSSISQIYALFAQKSDLLYRFSALQIEYYHMPHELDSALPLSMAEVHTLRNIEENPGITVTELAASGRKTKGAVSQIVKKLENRGYLFRERCPVDGKRALLHVNEEGKRLSQIFKKHSLKSLRSLLDGLLERCGMAEVDAFFTVAAAYVQLLEEELTKIHTP